MILAIATAGCPHYNSGLPHFLKLAALRQSSPVSGIYHTVAQGETLWAIARAYNTGVQDLAEVNNLKPAEILKVNSKLFIPGASQVKTVDATLKPSADESRIDDSKRLLAWPCQGEVDSEFGVRSGIQQNGIRIRARAGAPVRAAANGKVGYAGKVKGYGNVVLVEHADRLLTVYANLDQTRASKGEAVSKGHIIGTVGGTEGRDIGSLYFEVRSHAKPRNPRFFLEGSPGPR
jgi:murein DD-endopeptidase MepM/ murein hydrolase activator NlpD